MEKCSSCGISTQLHRADKPLCPNCSDLIDKAISQAFYPETVSPNKVIDAGKPGE